MKPCNFLLPLSDLLGEYRSGMLLRRLLLLVAVLPQLEAFAQQRVQGRVVDGRTSEPLAFVHVLPSGAREGATTDIDGRFSLDLPQLPATLRFSYVGYMPVEFVMATGAPVVVSMQRAMVELAAVEIMPTENPAHRIIDRTRNGRRTNDGMRFRSHRYTSYSKTVFTAEVDSTLRSDSARMAALDTNDREALAFFESQYLFLMESATRKTFLPPAAEKEEVLAMRVSGLQDPSLLALAAQTKTFSIYDAQIGISRKQYLGPLAPGSTGKYLFLLQDTLYDGRDSVFVISYAPRSRTKFSGLQGLLYIHTDGYAVQNVTAEAADRDEGFSIRFQQLHEKVHGEAWFPVQLNAFIYLDNVQVGVGKPYGVSRTYLKEIELDVDVARKEVRGAELVMDRMSTRQPDSYWSALRVDSLDDRELRTYHVIDSLGASVNLDRKLKWFAALAIAKVPVGPVDVLLDKVLRYNGYEGLRLGLGMASNDRVSRHLSLGGYFGYGLKDEALKYGGFLVLRPWYGRDMALKLFHENDVLESGGVVFEGPKPLITTESARMIYVDRMVQQERTGMQLAFRAGSALKIWLGAERELRMDRLGYRYAEELGEGVTALRSSFLTGGLSFGMRFAFRERVARLPDREVGMGTKWPVLSVSAYHAVDGLFDGEFSPWRLNASLDKLFQLRLLGELGLRLMAGVADPDAPYSYLFNLRGTNSRTATGGRTFLLAADNTFQTMLANEFLVDRYVALHMKHSFGTLLVKGKQFRPRPGVVYNAVVGDMQHPHLHRGIPFVPLARPFLEAGVLVDGLLTNLGVGVFYRHGAYAFEDTLDNFALKMTSSFSF